MRKSLLLLVISICLLMGGSLCAQETSTDKLPAQVRKVISHVLKDDYLEVYKGKPYRIQLMGSAFGDVDGDGCTEVFLLIDPHYQQTAPIQVFRILKNGKVRRLREALAPGPLIHVDGKRLDTHSLGLAVDMQVNGMTPIAARATVKKMSDTANFVLFRNFIHSDMPDRPSGFIDVTDRDEFKGVDKCDGIQFSQPKDIEVGTIKGASGGLRLAALVGEDVYVYQITKITVEGFLEKKMIRLPCTKDVKRIIRQEDGCLAFRFEDENRNDVEIRLP